MFYLFTIQPTSYNIILLDSYLEAIVVSLYSYMDYFDWECSPAATNVASSWSNQLHQMGDSSLIESFHENLNQKSNHMVQKLAVTGSTDSPNNAANFNYLWRQAAMKLAADSVLTKSGSSAETSSSAEFFSSAKRAHAIDPSTNGLISDLYMSELDYPGYIDDKATISTNNGSLESLDCLLSATNSNTNTSVQDDINSVLFSDGKKFWNSSSISAVDSETNTANIKSNYCSSLTNKTTSQCSPKRSNQCIGIISEPKLKKSRLEKLPSSSNINFQQSDNSSECTDCTEDHDSKTIVEMKEMLYRAAAFRPVNIEKMESVEKPKRKNVKISSDPQTVAARQRREKISQKIRVLQRLVPAGNKMDTASVLDEAANYLKFLRSQVKALESVGHKFDFVNCPISPMLYPFPHHSLLPFNHSFPMQTNHEFSFPKPRSS